MATTPRGYPYPALTDAPSGPTQIEALAQAIDTDLQSVADQRSVTAVMLLGRTSSLVEPVADATPDPVTSYDEGIISHIDSTGYLTLSGSGGITVAADGVVEWFGTGLWDSVPSGTPSHLRSIYLWKNGLQPTHEHGRNDTPVPAGSWGALARSGCGWVKVLAGDLLQLVFYQNTGAELDITSVVFGVSLKSLG